MSEIYLVEFKLYGTVAIFYNWELSEIYLVEFKRKVVNFEPYGVCMSEIYLVEFKQDIELAKPPITKSEIYLVEFKHTPLRLAYPPENPVRNLPCGI